MQPPVTTAAGGAGSPEPCQLTVGTRPQEGQMLAFLALGKRWSPGPRQPPGTAQLPDSLSRGRDQTGVTASALLTSQGFGHPTMPGQAAYSRTECVAAPGW